MAAKRRARRSRSDDSKEVGRNSANECSDVDDDEEESGKSGETAIPAEPKVDAGVQGSGESSPARGGVALKTKTTPSKRAKKPRPASQEEDEAEHSGDASPARGGPLPDDSADVGHDNNSAATSKRGEMRSPPPLQEEERPEKRAAGPDADPVAASAPRRKKKSKKGRRKKKKKQLRKAVAKPPSPQEDEHHGREMAEQEPSNTSPPQDEHRAREEEQQEKKTAEQEQEQHGQEQHADADGTSLAPRSPRLNLRSDPEPMGFWGVEVKPGEPYAHEFSGCVRITQATLGNLMSVGRTTITCSVGGNMPVSFCALNSTLATYRLDQEYGKGQNVVFSVIGDSSVHLAGYYKIPDAASTVQALVTQIHKADHRETTHVHGTAQKHNAIDSGVHNDGTNQMVGQAGLNAAANVQALVTQSQEAADHKTTHAHDIARGRNALETEVHTDCTNQMVGQSDPNITISDEASLGSGNRPVNNEDVGGPIGDELKIDELESGDCNAEMASYGKEVEVKYIGMLKDGKVVDSFEGGPAIHTFTLGVDNVIAGWHQGIQGMHVGGKRKLTIPPALGYKDIPQKRIPANSWLVYDIELLRVSEPGEDRET